MLVGCALVNGRRLIVHHRVDDADVLVVVAYAPFGVQVLVLVVWGCKSDWDLGVCVVDGFGIAWAARLTWWSSRGGFVDYAAQYGL